MTSSHRFNVAFARQHGCRSARSGMHRSATLSKLPRGALDDQLTLTERRGRPVFFFFLFSRAGGVWCFVTFYLKLTPLLMRMGLL